MPKYRMSPQQEMKFMQVLSGDIPLTAVAQYNMNAFKYNISDWTDYYKGMNMGSISLDRDREIRKHQGIVASWQDTQSQLVEQDKTARLSRINREAAATNIFYRALREGDWETAKFMTEEYAPLKKIYNTKMEDIKIKKYVAELKNLYTQGHVKNVAFQCVAFIIGYIRALYGRNLWLGAVGGETAGQLLKSAPEDFKALELKNERGEYNIIPSGSVMSNYGIWWNEKKQKYEQTTVGHTYMVLQDLGDELLIIEQAGELAAGDMPYLVEEGGDNLSEFTWKSGTAAFSGNTEQSKTVTAPRYHSYYNTEEGKHVLTMMPRIRKLKKSYFEGYSGLRAPVIAAPVSSAVQKAVSSFGEQYNR